MMAQFQDVQYRQNADDPGTFSYIPGPPSPELTSAGAPAASLVATGQGGLFQLGVQWGLAQSQLQDLQQYLRRQFPDLTSVPRLRPEMLTVDNVKLLLQMPDRSTSLLAVSSSAGYPPFAALFNLALDGARFTQAGMALSGHEGILKVQYEISQQSIVSCTTRISGDVRPDVQELDADADLDACRARINSAISDGRLQLTVSGDDVSAELREKTISTAKDRGAEALQRMLAGATKEKEGLVAPLVAAASPGSASLDSMEEVLDAANLTASATLTDTRPVKLAREADVGQWFTGGNAVKMFIAATPATGSGGVFNRDFKLSFDAKDFPIAFIQVSSGDTKEALQPPAFNPVTVRVDPAKPVIVTTHYTDGGPAYQVKVNAADKAPLTPGQLGFCLVEIDGSARKEAGAKRLKMRVKYLPQSNGTEDEHNINWGYGDWTDSWCLVSRDSGLGGVIEYSWQETASDGTVVDHPPLKTSQTQLKL